MHDHPPCRSATLSGGAHGAEKDRLHRHLEIGARRDDERVVAAEFQDGSTEPTVNGFARHCTPCCTSRWPKSAECANRPPMLRRRSLVADQQREDRRISTSLPAHSFGELCDGDRAQWCFVRRLPNHRVTAHAASAAFHDHTATGKLNAVITPTTPSGCHCSISRWCGRSDAMVRP